jgi:glutathione peroxidase-family protein
MLRLQVLTLFSLGLLSSSFAFQSNNPASSTSSRSFSSSSSLYTKTTNNDEHDDELFSLSNNNSNNNNDRRSFLTSGTTKIMGLAVAATSFIGNANADDAESEGVAVGGGAVVEQEAAVVAAAVPAVVEEEESFASIAARANDLSRDAGDRTPFSVITNGDRSDKRTAYDFEIPISGNSIPFKDIIHQEIDPETGYSKCKVILVSNMKEDDPIARKDIPEMISLASKYGRDGQFAVILSPTDQGYYEPDTSQLIRLKLASEYGYGINPATILTDKVNMLGKTALPFWRWLQSNCRTPAGLGRVEGNFEKFLVDGRTGLPLRRYPRKYKPSAIKNDIEAIIAGRPLPPAGANFREEWRSAAVEAEAGTYRFQKGLNYYD